jgi:cytochrome c556
MRLPAVVLIGLASLAAAAVLAPPVVTAQTTRKRATPSAQTAYVPPPAKETIFARKIMMSTIGDNMDEMEAMIEPGAKFETEEAREHANLVSVMLLAFPHMFPPATNQWKQGADRDAAYDTYASPGVWQTFKDFQDRSNAASKIALEAAKAPTVPDYKRRVAELRTTCDSCHAQYLKVDPQPARKK